MILFDTSIWIDHLRKGNERLSFLLDQEMVLTHPFLIGELACGFLVNRREILELLETLPQVSPAGHEEVMHLVESKRLHGSGIGWIDAHLLTSALLWGSLLWTGDKKLGLFAKSLGVAYR